MLAYVAPPEASAQDGRRFDGCYGGSVTLGKESRPLHARIENGRISVAVAHSGKDMKDRVRSDLDGKIDAAGAVTARGQYDDWTLALAGAAGEIPADRSALFPGPGVVVAGTGQRRRVFTSDELPVTFDLKLVTPLLADQALIDRLRERQSGWGAAIAVMTTELFCKGAYFGLCDGKDAIPAIKVKPGDKLC